MSAISSFTVNSSVNIQVHSHEYAHIILPLRQNFYVKFLGRAYNLTPHQIGFVPPGVLHEFGCPGTALTLNIPAEMVKSTDLVFLSENCVLDIDSRLEPLICLIKQEIDRSDSSRESLRYLFYYLYDKFVERHRLPSLRYMHENYAEPVSIAKLAALENYNASYYTDWFKRKVGCMPSEYLQMVRIDKAKEILATTRYRVLDVAMQVGYINSSSFARAFKSVTGLTPGQYRKQISENKSLEKIF